MTIPDFARVVGVAWEESTTSQVKSVRVGLGLPASHAWRLLGVQLDSLRGDFSRDQGEGKPKGINRHHHHMPGATDEGPVA